MAALAGAATASGAPSPGPPAELVFLNAPAAAQPLRDVPRLAVRVGDGPVRAAVVDTGSTGVLLSAAAIPGIDRLPQLEPGSLT